MLIEVDSIFPSGCLFYALIDGRKTQETTEPLVEFVKGQLRPGTPSDHHEIDVSAEIATAATKPLSRPTFEAVPDDRVADLSARRDPKSTSHVQ